MSTSTTWAGAVLTALALAVPATAQAATAPATGPGLTLTPARVEEDLTGHRATQRISLVNGDEVPHDVTIEVTGLGHDLLGTPEFVVRGAGSFRVDGPARVTIGPGESHEVVVDVDFTGAVAAYGAVVATLDPGTADLGDVGVVNRVAGLLLLRGPGPWDQRVELAAVGLESDEDDTQALLLLDLANVGDAHVRPSGRVTVFDRGQPIATLDLVGEVVLPGSARRHAVPWIPPAHLGGTVEVVVELDGQATARADLELGGVPERVAVARALAGLPPGGATFAGPAYLLPDVGGGRPLSWLPLLALLLLLVASESLRRVWSAERDGDQARLPADRARRV